MHTVHAYAAGGIGPLLLLLMGISFPEPELEPRQDREGLRRFGQMLRVVQQLANPLVMPPVIEMGEMIHVPGIIVLYRALMIGQELKAMGEAMEND